MLPMSLRCLVVLFDISISSIKQHADLCAAYILIVDRISRFGLAGFVYRKVPRLLYNFTRYRFVAINGVAGIETVKAKHIVMLLV